MQRLAGNIRSRPILNDRKAFFLKTKLASLLMATTECHTVQNEADPLRPIGLSESFHWVALSAESCFGWWQNVRRSVWNSTRLSFHTTVTAHSLSNVRRCELHTVKDFHRKSTLLDVKENSACSILTPFQPVRMHQVSSIKTNCYIGLNDCPNINSIKWPHALNGKLDAIRPTCATWLFRFRFSCATHPATFRSTSSSLCRIACSNNAL